MSFEYSYHGNKAQLVNPLTRSAEMWTEETMQVQRRGSMMV